MASIPDINDILGNHPPPTIDNRSRSERKEDYERELSKINKDSIIKLHDQLVETGLEDSKDPKELRALEKEITNTLAKFIRYIDKYDELNANDFRKVELKRKELRLEGQHDWANKFRLFLFRVLASALFIITIFTIGYLESKYDWAILPLSKYVANNPEPPK